MINELVQQKVREMLKEYEDLKLYYDECEFFENKKLLKKKFGIYSDLIEPYFVEAASYAPNKEKEREIFEKIRNTTIRHADCRKMGSVEGFSQRIGGDGWYQNGIVVANIDYNESGEFDVNDEWAPDIPLDEVVARACKWYFSQNDAKHRSEIVCKIANFIPHNVIKRMYFKTMSDLTKDNHKLVVFHELNHCLSSRETFLVPKCAKVETYEQVANAAVELVEENVAECNAVIACGNSSFVLYEIRGSDLIEITRPASALLREEAVVEEWAQSLGSKLGVTKLNYRTYNALLNNISYKPFIYLVGMWNLLSDNELRRRHISGNKSKGSEATDEFNKRFDKLLISCAKGNELNDMECFDSSDYDAKIIGQNLREVVDFIDAQKGKVKLTPEQQKYFDYCHRRALYTKHICNYLSINTEFADEKTKSNFARTLSQACKQKSEIMTR